MNEDYDFHPEASIDLEDIWEFIADDSSAAADRVIADILETIEGLVSFPHQGHHRPDLTSRPLRFTIRRAGAEGARHVHAAHPLPRVSVEESREDAGSPASGTA